MSTDTPRPERTETDASLQAERSKTDDAIAQHGSAVEDQAKRVVERARAQADLVLEAARDEADASGGASGQPSAADVQVADARASEDVELAAERAAADATVEAERAVQQEAFRLLLALERGETNQNLRMERQRADRVVASRDDFLGMVSHDVRGLLAGMAMSAELLVTTDGASPDVAHREGRRVQRLTARMNRLIGDLLDVVSMESGRLEVIMVPEDAAALVGEVLESFEGAAESGSVRLVAEVSGPVRASFDRGRMLQVLTNLVGNALKFTPPGGTITVGLAAAAGGIEFVVRDDGRGIPADRLDAIFERFTQAHVHHDRRGLGLGLYIARSIMLAHGGQIWAESELGRGSAFHVTLPTGAA